MNQRVRALGLLSGGLDSMLAVKVLQAQGIEVAAITFVTPFFGPAAARKAVESLDIHLTVEDITNDYMGKVLKNPRYGYGRNMNPCVDCHAFMFSLAGKRMDMEGMDFLFSGEVLGERPFSQNRQALRIVAVLSGYADRILRPLSARLLEETRPEREGLVDRKRLCDIQGRSRRHQMQMASAFGISSYPSPAGGCLLTEPNFSRRLRDLLKHDPNPEVRDLELLKLGRHLRFDETAKIVVGRREEENDRIEQLWRPGDLRLWVNGVPGPVVLLRSGSAPASNVILFAASLAVRYSDAEPGSFMEVAYTDGFAEGVLRAKAFEESEIQKRML